MYESFQVSETPIPGAYALYSAFGIIPRHLGRVTGNGMVISKWGTLGNVYEHEPLMVPLQYGDKITYYLPPES